VAELFTNHSYQTCKRAKSGVGTVQKITLREGNVHNFTTNWLLAKQKALAYNFHKVGREEVQGGQV
jgi:hypothetical protein